jgi:4-amino-4-deoxy-L-arabinose transferase-like glycosyltransferase
MSPLRRTLRRLPLACWACAAIAFTNGALWAVITPSFQVPDEIDHFSYVQYVGERGKLPGRTPKADGLYSQELAEAVAAIPWNVENRPSWYARDARIFKRRQQAGVDHKPGSAGSTTINNQPLYYVLEVIPYRLARSADILDRLFLMRLFSALLAAVTVAFAFLFVREVLPRPPWAATIGGLAVAFQPVFGFISGGVNNDNLLWTCSAALIYLIARVLRRGLTPRLGLALGGVALAGVLTKTSFAGLLPGAALACLIAVWRAPAPQRRPALVGALAAGGVLAIFSGAWLLAAQALFGRTANTATAGFVSTAVNQRTSLSGQLSYLWQVFLPRLPHMTPFLNFGGEYPLWNPYFQSFIGRFGWFRFGFPMWVNWMALGIFGAIFALVGNALFRARRAVRGRWLELACYLTVMAGYFGLVEVASYRFQVVNHAGFEQVRYLLPLLPFYALLVAVAAVGAGRRWGHAVGALLVVLAVTHSLFAMLLVIGHYYT